MIDLQNPKTWVASRELDAEVAKIMGLDVCEYRNGTIAVAENGVRIDLPHYSATGNGMLLMLEWAMDKGYSFGLWVSPHGGKSEARLCLPPLNKFNPNSVFTGNSTENKLPEAIARAILDWHAAQQEGETG